MGRPQNLGPLPSLLFTMPLRNLRTLMHEGPAASKSAARTYSRWTARFTWTRATLCAHSSRPTARWSRRCSRGASRSGARSGEHSTHVASTRDRPTTWRSSLAAAGCPLFDLIELTTDQRVWIWRVLAGASGTCRTCTSCTSSEACSPRSSSTPSRARTSIPTWPSRSLSARNSRRVSFSR